jgi:fibronectin-binding autotransporter adhesin
MTGVARITGLMKVLLQLAAAFFSLLGSCAFAGSATWNLNPGDGDWNKPANWTPATVPNGPGDIATFDFSNLPSVSLSASTEVGALEFNPGAPIYLITPRPGNALTVSGTGITNNSGQLQSFATMVTGSGKPAEIFFVNSASAGSSTAFLNQGGGSLGNGTSFFDTATAGNGTFTNAGGSVFGGLTQFVDSATAGNATFINLASQIFLGGAGHTNFFGTSTAGQATITNSGGTGSFLFPGTVFFDDMSDAGESLITSNGADLIFGTGAFATFDGASSAGNATIIANGGNVSGATTAFTGHSTAGRAALIANGHSGQSGGLITFQESSTGARSRIELSGSGALDISLHQPPGTTIGSLEGDGEVQLGTNQLAVGGDNRNTTFAGVIDGTGSLIKSGRGRLILGGVSSYSGGTLIKEGTLLVARLAGSATGNGPVQVDKGTLGGSGRIAGPVTIGNGIGAASLSPGRNSAKPARLSLQRTITFRSLASYDVTLDSTTATADEAAASGVTIESGALAFIEDIGMDEIAVGTIFTIISNTSASPIAGTFANLGDGSSFTLNGNKFLVSYEGGDGNDLTLTVEP